MIRHRRRQLDTSGEATQFLTVHMPPGFRERLRMHCFEQDVLVGDFVADALREALRVLRT